MEEPSGKVHCEIPQDDSIDDPGEISIVLNWENSWCCYYLNNF